MPIAMSDRRTVGTTKLAVPPLGLGGAHLGELYAKVDEADSRATLEAARSARGSTGSRLTTQR